MILYSLMKDLKKLISEADSSTCNECPIAFFFASQSERMAFAQAVDSAEIK